MGLWVRSWQVPAWLMIAAVGCGGGSTFKVTLAPVTGTVTVDGQPAEGLLVMFEPQVNHQAKDKDKLEVGKASTGVTDAAGKFELTYPGGGKGAIIGSHLVKVMTMGDGGGADPEGVPASKYKIPAKYNTGSGRYEDVKAGENSINIEIKTK